MKLEFDNVDELKAFYEEFIAEDDSSRPKRTRKAKDGTASTGQAPDPISPPASAGQMPAFNPQGGNVGFTAPPAGGAAAGPFAAAGAPTPAPQPATGPSPEIVAIVARIVARTDGAIAAGQPATNVEAWFRGQLQQNGIAEGAAATLDQIKQSYLFRLPMPALEFIAKNMNA